MLVFVLFVCFFIFPYLIPSAITFSLIFFRHAIISLLSYSLFLPSLSSQRKYFFIFFPLWKKKPICVLLNRKEKRREKERGRGKCL
jgi:hypothetical protein